MEVNTDLSIQNISILISAAVFIYSLIKDKNLKDQVYADKIRIAAGTTIANLERWKKLSLRYFQDIEHLITETDIKMVETKNNYLVRDYFWMGLDEKWPVTYQRIIDEKVEMRYTDLYGYDINLGELFTAAINELSLIDEKMHKRLRSLTQEIILETPEDVKPTELGNNLRKLCGNQRDYCEKQMDLIIAPVQEELKKLVTEKDDGKIVNKEVKINKSSKVFDDYLKANKPKINQDDDILISNEDY